MCVMCRYVSSTNCDMIKIARNLKIGCVIESDSLKECEHGVTLTIYCH